MAIYLGNSTGSYYVGSDPVGGMYMGDSVAWLPGVTDSLFFYLDASTSTIPYDLTLNSGTGSLNFNAVHTTLSGVPTFYFPDFTSNIEFAHTDSMNVDMPATNFGASFWTQKTSTSTNFELLSKGSNYTFEYGGSSTISSMELQAQSNAGASSNITVALSSAGSVNTWYHYAYSVTYTGTQYQFSLYRDGAFINTTSVSATTYANFGTVTNTGNLKISSGRKEYIQYMKLFKKALTADEVALEYNSTKDRF